MAGDAAGDVYIAGRVSVAGQGVQMLAMKLDGGNGTIDWMEIRGGAAGADDIAWDVVVGPDGNPVFSGHTIEAGNVARCLTRKLAAATGARVWEAVTTESLADIGPPSDWLAVRRDGDILHNEGHVAIRAKSTGGGVVEQDRGAKFLAAGVLFDRTRGVTHLECRAEHAIERESAGCHPETFA